MTEKLLQFIWQFQYFNRGNLSSIEGEEITIIHPGQLNLHQGPDFFNGRIKIGDKEWAGHIELHLKSSDWVRHNHQTDPFYGRVILHVVWRHDIDVHDENGQIIPVVTLENRVSRYLLNQYEEWMNVPNQIPCGTGISQINSLVWKSWLDRLLAERLLEKCRQVATHIEKTESHWEEVCWRMVCTYFGGPVNKVSFAQLAESLPIRILAKHKSVLIQLEALLLGQAGLLHKKFEDDYPKLLFREYQFLQKKYSLQVINKPPVFLRMRPGDFPTIRLAQLAALIHQSSHLFSKLVEVTDLKAARKLFEVTANDYWNNHFKPDTVSTSSLKTTGKSLIDRVIINGVVPVLFSYGHYQANDAARNKALKWLEEIPAESNRFTSFFSQLGKKPAHAGESQAMLTLKQEYCDAKRCLQCAIGNQLLKNTVQATNDT